MKTSGRGGHPARRPRAARVSAPRGPALRDGLEGFVVSPPGFEDLLATELRAVGVGEVLEVRGGVVFRGGWADIYRANLMSRVGSRVLVRVARFEATTFPLLERELGKIDWQAWLPEQPELDVRVAKSRTRLFHTGKVADVVRDVIANHASQRGLGSRHVPCRLQMRIAGPQVTLSLDTSGDHLHRRGYRARQGPAPIRENLAAGLLMRAGWDGSEPLLDPFCGSGTFPIEGVLLALGTPPGLQRRFAFEDLPSFHQPTWQGMKDEAAQTARTSLWQPVFASDHAAEAVARTVWAAREAGVADLLQVAEGDVRELTPGSGPGLLVANPPYERRLRGLGPALGALREALDGTLAGWRWGIVAPEKSPAAVRRFLGGSSFRFTSGGIRLGFYQGRPSNPLEEEVW